MKFNLFILFFLILHAQVYASKVKITGNVLCDEDCKSIKKGRITLKIIDSGSSGKEYTEQKYDLWLTVQVVGYWGRLTEWSTDDLGWRHSLKASSWS